MKLAETVTFGGGQLDRRGDLRAEADGLSRLDSSRHMVVWHGKVLCDGDRLVLLTSGQVKIFGSQKQDPIYLGEADGEHYFAHDVSFWDPPDGIPDTLGAFSDPSIQTVDFLKNEPSFCEIRSVMAEFSVLEAELTAAGKAILSWHLIHGYCARCGSKTQTAEGGWRRDCPACKGQHFPRTDPVVIMLITHGNSVLVGRSPGWPDGMYSLLAGFVEPGETIESAVRREVLEESGIRVGRVGYLASQPWPFPSSLMLGCWGEATSHEITIDPNELEDAIWITREEMLSVFAGEHPHIKAPRRGAIAGFILDHWLKDLLD